MRRRSSPYLVLAGSLLVVVGTASTVTLVIRRDHCTADVYAPNPACQGYTPSIHWSYLVILLGAACFVAAALFGRAGRRAGGNA
jgi:hypothetical protein